MQVYACLGIVSQRYGRQILQVRLSYHSVFNNGSYRSLNTFLNAIVAFIIAVMANVVSDYITK